MLPILESTGRGWAGRRVRSSPWSRSARRSSPSATLALIAVLAARRRRSTMALARSRGASGRRSSGRSSRGAPHRAPGGGRGRCRRDRCSCRPVASTSRSPPRRRRRRHGRRHRRDDPRGRARAGPGAGRWHADRDRHGRPPAHVRGADRRGRDRRRAPPPRSAASRPFSDANGGAGLDPLVAAVPALVGLAAGILVVRLYRDPARGRCLARRPRPRPDPDARGPSSPAKAARRRPCCSCCSRPRPSGAFAATALDHLERGAEVAAWQQVGATYRAPAADRRAPDRD